MAGNITPTVAANFIPEIWANRALEVLRSNVVAARLVMTDSQIDGGFRVGDKLNIPYTGSFTAETKTPGSAVTLQQPTDGTVTVTLDTHKEVSFLVEDVSQATANQSLMDRYLEAAVPALAEAIESAVLAEYVRAGSTIGTYGTDLDAADVLSLRQAFNTAKASQSGRVLVVSSKDEVSMLGDDDLKDYFANARPEAVAEGSMGRVYGFDVYMSQLVTQTAATPVQTHNMAFHRNAIILAMRALPTPPENTGAQVAVVRDPVSGLALRVVMAYNASYLGLQVTIDALWGVKIARAAHVIEAKA